jgi:thiol:disulfide interchange protein DsbC
MNVSVLFDDQARRAMPRFLLIGAAGVVIGVAGFGLTKTVLANEAGDAGLARKVQAAFPNTKVASVHCGVVPGLCEVTAGKTVFYVTPDARYAVVGSVLDLKARVDVTDRRIKELGQLDAVTSRLGATPPAVTGAQGQPGDVAANTEAAPTMGPIKIDLPRDNAIVHHPGAPLKVSVVTDLNCGFCRMLMEALKTAPDIELTEYPIQLLRPDSLDKAKLALCSTDREATANNIYFGGDLKVAGDCSKAEAAVQANTAFARAHGISGTPALIRADGATHAGFMPIDQLRAWIKGGQA